MTLSDPKVVAELRKDFIPVHLNASNDFETASQLGVMSVPDLRFMSAKGQVLVQHVGFLPPADFLKKIEESRAKAG